MGGNWLKPIKTSHTAEWRLVCFPFGGGGANAFWAWQHEIPKSVELWALCLPGREHRISEPFVLNPRDVLRHVLEDLVRVEDKHLILYGHSLGAGLALAGCSSSSS